jgi:glycosyltransferase involved in cell wall biosynthesis
MNILLLAYYFPPIVSGGSQRPARMFNHLNKLGNRVTVLASTYEKALPPEQNTIRIYDPSHNMNRRGVRRLQWLLQRMPIEIGNYFGKYSSIYSRWQQNVLGKADEILLRSQPEIIIATYPPVEVLQIGLLLSQKAQVPLVADFRDGLLFEPVESKRLHRFTSLQQKYATIEGEIAAKAAAIITISPYLSAYFKRTYNLKNVTTIPNGYDADDLLNLSGKTDFDANVLHIVHAGKIGLSDATRSLLPFITAVEQLFGADPTLAKKMHLHFVGRLSAKEMKALSHLKKRGIVSLYGERERAFSLAMQSRADLLLLITSAARPGIAPGKLFEYLAMQKPILALDDGTFAGEIIRETNSGWIVPAHDSRAIGEILEKIIPDREIRAARTCTAESIEIYSASQQMRQLNAVLQQIHSGKTPAHES